MPDVLLALGLRTPDPGLRTFSSCTGCDLCLLACPVWQQTRDERLTPKGRAKALQGGASPFDLVESASACVMCGSCEPACPERIDTVEMTLSLRRQIAATGRSPMSALVDEAAPPRADTRAAGGKTWLLAEARLAADGAALASATLRLGGPAHVVVADDPRDIAAALEAGLVVPPDRLRRFLAPLRSAHRIVTCDGFLNRFLRSWLPGTRVAGIGEACLALAEVRSAIRRGDLYIVDARAYHADWKRLVRVYDALRQETGCLMNLDLQRFAIPTAATSLPTRNHQGPVRVQEQVRWLLEGRFVKRVIVENLDDGEAFRERGLEVVHVAALPAVTS